MGDFIKDTIERAAAASVQAPEDYIDETTGLLMCGVCHQRKQMPLDIVGNHYIVPVACKCEEERQQRRKAAAEEHERQMRLKRRRERCFGRGDRKAAFTFAIDDRRDEKTSDIMRGYVEHFAEMKEKGKGLFLLGPVGTGKTFYACAIANGLMEKGYTAIVTTFAEIANDLQNTFDKSAVYDDLNSVDLLVIDDLAAERETQFMQEIVFTVIDSRCTAKKPLIVTSNLTAKEFAEPSGTARWRVLSRLQEACLPVTVTGTDRRRERMLTEAAAELGYLAQKPATDRQKAPESANKGG